MSQVARSAPAPVSFGEALAAVLHEDRDIIEELAQTLWLARLARRDGPYDSASSAALTKGADQRADQTSDTWLSKIHGPIEADR